MRSSRHLSFTLLDELIGSGEGATALPPEFFVHLIELCPECSAAWHRWSELQGVPPSREQLLHRGLGAWNAASVRPAEREQVKRELRSLFRHEPGDRLQVIGKSRSWYRHPLLVEELLQRTRDSMPEEPSEAEHHARLAYAAASQSARASDAGLDALAAAHVANTLRAQGRLREADEQMKHARVLAERPALADRRMLGELDYMEGGLRKDQRRLDEAERLLGRAIGHFRTCRAAPLLASALLTYGVVQANKAALDGAILATAAALELIDPVAEPRLHLNARHNLALYLCDAQRIDEAQSAFEENQPLYDRFSDRWTQLRRTWLAGRLAAGREDWGSAEVHFKRVVAGFVNAGIGYDAALAALDLADLYLSAGETRKLRLMAKGLSAILRSEDLHREATAAILLLQKALADEIVSKNLLDHVRGYLEESRNNPALRFEPSP